MKPLIVYKYRIPITNLHDKHIACPKEYIEELGGMRTKLSLSSTACVYIPPKLQYTLIYASFCLSRSALPGPKVGLVPLLIN